MNAQNAQNEIGGDRNASQLLDISQRTLRRYSKLAGIKKRFAESLTNARNIATNCIYNVLTFAALAYYMWNILKASPLLVFNTDGTLYSVGGCGGDKVEVLYIENDRDPRKMANTKNGRQAAILEALERKRHLEPKSETKVEEDPDEKDGSFVPIKHYAVIGATGTVMPPMLIIADDQMGPEEIDIHEVKGLSIGTEIEGFGYVVFTKTRATFIMLPTHGYWCGTIIWRCGYCLVYIVNILLHYYVIPYTIW